MPGSRRRKRSENLRFSPALEGERGQKTGHPPGFDGDRDARIGSPRPGTWPERRKSADFEPFGAVFSAQRLALRFFQMRRWGRKAYKARQSIETHNPRTSRAIGCRVEKPTKLDRALKRLKGIAAIAYAMISRKAYKARQSIETSLQYGFFNVPLPCRRKAYKARQSIETCGPSSSSRSTTY
jgi:hypothetical protein